MTFDDELERGRLVVEVCDACGGRGARAWPAAGFCPGCLGPVRRARIPPCGLLVEHSRAADGRRFCLAEFARGVRLMGVLLAPADNGGGGGGGGGGDNGRFEPRVRQRVVLESCSLSGGRPVYAMRAAGGREWPPHCAGPEPRGPLR